MGKAPLVEVVIEVPKGSIVKRCSSGRLDFISPIPCPFNYGSIDSLPGPDNDLLDAAVLGPRLCRGTRLTVPVVGSIRIIDRGLPDDKVICSSRPVGALKRSLILLFFKFYAKCKGLINFWRGHSGRNYCHGWQDVRETLERAAIRKAGGSGNSRPLE
jgi:inorganic pyrophosphatase